MLGPIADPFSHPMQINYLPMLILSPMLPCLQLKWLTGQIKAQSITSMH